MKLGKLLKRIDDKTLIQVFDEQTHKGTSPEYVADFTWREGVMERKVGRIEILIGCSFTTSEPVIGITII